MWLYLVVLMGLYYLLRWYRERQVVSHLRDKFVFITGCDSGFGNLLARQLDLRGLRVLAACLTEQGAEQLRNQTSDRLQTVILDVTKTESIAEATEWVKEDVGDRGLWGLVNNAGILLPAAPNEWQTKDDFSKILNVNLIGLIEDILEGIWSQVSPEVKESYGQKYFEDYCQYFHGLIAKGKENLSPVASFMEHNLTAVHPRICYSIDWNSKCFTFALSYLPTPVADLILCHIL